MQVYNKATVEAGQESCGPLEKQAAKLSRLLNNSQILMADPKVVKLTVATAANHRSGVNHNLNHRVFKPFQCEVWFCQQVGHFLKEKQHGFKKTNKDNLKKVLPYSKPQRKPTNNNNKNPQKSNLIS